MKFTHLHVHSHYSLLDGLAKIDDLISRAKELGMDSLALTDHGVMYGSVEFFIKAKEAGIKPIIGCEMYLTLGSRHSKNNTQEDKTRYHLTLLVRNEQGYKNLMKLVSIAHLEGFYYKPRIDKKVLEKYSEGLLGMSGCIQGEVPQTALNKGVNDACKVAKWYEDIFGKGNFYMELQHHPKYEKQKEVNAKLLEVSQETGIPVVATGDIHYAKPEDAETQDILLCIQMNKKITDTNRMSLMDFDLSMKSQEEMTTAFKDIPEAIANTQKIVDKCNYEIKLGETQLPFFEVPKGFDDESYLKHLTEKGLKEKIGDTITDEYRKRLDYELSIIKKMGYPSYFLIVQDFVNWARNAGVVVGPGRGSAAGSLVSYLIGITNLDPIKYDLLFERFLNPERISMPDVDMDFADDRRDDVLNYVREKYGNDHVANIITFGTMAARGAIRDTGRALDYPYDYCDRTSKMIPMFSTIEQALENSPEFKKLYDSETEAKKLIDSAKKLEGVARHASMHACGVVITKKPVTEYSPLQKITGKDKGDGVVTQYSSSTKYSFVEKIGLLKMDFLGLKNLTIIQNAINIIEKTKGVKINIDDIPLDDKITYKLLQKAMTTGVFQLESSGMKRYLKELKPTNLEDVIAMVALYRPGPMDWIPDFINRKHGRKRIEYLHPKLEPILKKTYGVAVYQEQVMQMAQSLAGFSLGEADMLRKAMGKKIPELIKKEKIKFVEGAVKNGVNKKDAESIFAFIEPFAGYGFNRCLTGDTLISDATTGQQWTIENLYAKYQAKKKLPKVFSLNEKKLKLQAEKITKVYFNGIKTVYEVTTALGKVITATSNHPFYTFSGWKNLADLKKGDLIASVRTMPIKNKEKFPVENFQLIVLGYLLAEGNLCHPAGFYFYSTNKLELKDYSQNLIKFKNTKSTKDTSKSATSIYAGRIDLTKKSEAVEWIKSLGLYGARTITKKFPSFVFKLNQNQLALLIGKMFQGDGCINLKRKDAQIFYATSSKILAKQLQHLFLRLNIITTIHKKKFKYRSNFKIGYTVSINRYDNIQKFCILIGKHLIGEKQKNTKKILHQHPIINGQLKINSARGSKDIVPVAIRPLITNSILAKNYSLRKFAKKYNFSERLFYKDNKKKGYLRETISLLSKKLSDKELLKFAQSDIYWDEIKSIRKVGNRKTYDLTIENTHNFVANDFIVHNSHAACYGMIGYQTAYLKAHYPTEFMAALMTSDQGNIERIAIEVEEARDINIEILPPNINESFGEFTVIKSNDGKENIRFGLNAVKNVGHTIAKEIVIEREKNGRYVDLVNFLERVTGKDLNKKSIEALAKVGALDDLGERNQIINNIETILSFSKNIQKMKNSNQDSLFGGMTMETPSITLEETPPASKKQKLHWEKELLGLYVSDHPISDYKEFFEKMTIPITSLNDSLVNRNIKLGGVITKVQKIVTKRKQNMAFVTIEDLRGRIELLVFPNVLEETGLIWQEEKIITVDGKISDKDGTFKLIVSDAKIINKQEVEDFKRVLATQEKNGQLEPTELTISISTPDQNIIKKLSELFSTCNFGKTKIYLIVENKKIQTSYSIKLTDDIQDKLKIIVPAENIKIKP